MSLATQPTSAKPAIAVPLAIASIVFVTQLALIGLIYKHGIDFYCLGNWPARACSGASGVLVSTYAVIAVLAMFLWFRPAQFKALVAQAGHSWTPLLLNAAGFVIALVPLAFLKDGSGDTYLVPTFLLWGLGFIGLVLGVLWFVAPLARWRTFASEVGVTLVSLLALGACAPLLATLIRPLWQVETLANSTFVAVAVLIESFGYDLYIDPVQKIIGRDDFAINVAPVCSGIEGIALVTIFVTIYLVLFRQTLKFPTALVLYPIAIILSAALNVVRISVLLIIGLEGNPELAVGGFHSHAGWLMFTLLSIGIVLAAPSIPFIQKTVPKKVAETQTDLPPFFKDPSVAFILPFAVFMFSALLSQILSNSPGLIYPLRVVMMAAAIAIFIPVYKKLVWVFSLPSVLLGAVVGVVWIAVPVSATDVAPPYAGLTGSVLIVWFVLRGVGTSILVPVIEENFFRGYLEPKITVYAGALLAACVSAAIFAVLHDRWVEAIFASLVFSYVSRQLGGVTQAIISHAVANVIVFTYAVVTNSIHII